MITQCQRRDKTRGGIVDPPCANACRALRQTIGNQIRCFVTRAKTSRTSHFAVIRRLTGIWAHTSDTYYRLYKVATSCVNRCASWIYHIRIPCKKLQENPPLIVSTESLSLATHNRRDGTSSSKICFASDLKLCSPYRSFVRQALGATSPLLQALEGVRRLIINA
jgi:hypothetical protein